MQNYTLVGMPGSGKGTMAKKLEEDYGFVHLSMGELIRQEQVKGSKIGILGKKLSDNGLFLPDSIVIQMFQQFIADNPTDVGYIFDGFPRNREQVKHFNAFLLKSKIPFSGAIYLDLDKKEAVRRLALRAEKENRKDDTPDLIKDRIVTFEKETKPILEFFQNRGKLIVVDAKGSIEEQYETLKKGMEI